MNERQWLIVDTTGGEYARFSKIAPSERPIPGAVHKVALAGKPTFTDVLQAYARETGENLGELAPLFCIAGAASGETISFARANWTVTRAGLSTLFGTRVRVINDVVAMAWGAQSDRARIAALRGARAQPDFKRPGRMIMLFVGDGVGAAIVDIDRDGRRRVMETEAGHLEFAAHNERELRIAEKRRGDQSQTSWEQMLTLGKDDALWDGFTELRALDRERMLGEWFGRYVVGLVHAYGAWDGAILAGPRVASLTGAGSKTSFDGAFVKRRTFQRLVMQAPVWTVSQDDPILTGGAALMAIRAAEGRGSEASPI
ncbi:glucokinase [Sphingomicrobium sp. XHP0235]|uniref:glucokinase n=1 Tax=Sphingomicrobium aquimarinum TaxID=3133971 RepID=UPI0031FEE1F4